MEPRPNTGSPRPSNRHHRSNGDCLEGKGEIISLFCAILCATIVHSAMHTHDLTVLWIGFWSHWAHFTVLRFICVWCITVCCMHA